METEELERDREFVREFEAAVLRDLAVGRRLARRAVLKAAGLFALAAIAAGTLDALDHTRALPTIRKAVKNPGYYLNVWLDPEVLSEVKAVAEKCLQSLEARAEEEQIRASLLRPIEMPSEDHNLLRPTLGGESVGES